MAKQEDPSKKIQESKEVAEGMLDALQSIMDKVVAAIDEMNDGLQNANTAAEVIGETMRRGIVQELKQSVKNQEDLIKLSVKAAKGEADVKEIAKQRQKIQENQALAEAKLAIAKKKGLKEQEKLVADYLGYLKEQEEELAILDQINGEKKLSKGLSGAIGDNIKGYVDDLDKSGTLSALFNKNIGMAAKAAFLMEAAMAALVAAAWEGSENINKIQKETGISYKNAFKFQGELAIAAARSEKLFVTSKDLSAAFSTLVEQTGLLADYGGDTLVTMTTLTKQLGLGANEATQLSLLARTQSADTETVLKNTVDTVNAVNKQNKSSISAKQVLNDVATASKAIVVSLGMSPEILAEAATEARALGLTLEKVDAIAGSLLDFESSIEKELTAELLTGKQINLEKARELALTNDLTGLTKEIGENQEIIDTFATGNRIQQQAIADALGMSRDDLANMVYQQELLNMGQDAFVEKYGEQAYEQMQAQSAAEKFEAAMEKIKGVITDIGTIFSPILDGFASLVGFLAESKVLIVAIAAALGGMVAYQSALAIKSMVTAISNIWSGNAPLGPFGVALSVAGTAGLIGAIASGVGAIQAVNDGIADSSRGPFSITDAYGATAITAKGDSLAVSPNVTRGGGDDKMLAALEKIANKDTNVYMDSQKVGGSMALASSKL